MGGYSASSTNVNFDYATALQAACDLYVLSRVVADKHRSRAGEAALAVDGWVGGHRDTFDTKLSTEGTDVETIRGALVTLAGKFASEWAAAWGEQDRINFARYVEKQKEEDSWVEDGAELVVGEDDYGAPPDDPPVPQAPGFAPTRAPKHVEFENADRPRTMDAPDAPAYTPSSPSRHM
ncbi:MAG: hypothetical protein PV358_11460 [Acidimicrobiales bacterium]|nr:hypothetical protein [Acidimicrobiales bacterium]